MMKKLIRIIVVCAFLLVTLVDVSPLAAQDVATDPAVNKALLTDWWQVEAEHDYTQLDDFFTPDFVRHSIATSAVMPDTRITNLEEYAQFLEGTAAMFPDYSMTPQMLTADGDYVAFYSTFSGTFAQNGNPIEIPMAGFARFEGGKIAELWVEWDNVTWNAQMMAAPAELTQPAEQPISGVEDVVGVWSIGVYLGDHPLRVAGELRQMKLTLDGHVYVGNASCRDCVVEGVFTVADGAIHFPGSPIYPEATYAVFVTRTDGQPTSLRFALIGEDGYAERKLDLNGHTLYPVEAVEVPLASAEDVAGVWDIQIDGAPFLLTLLPDGAGTIDNSLRGGTLSDATNAGGIEQFTYAIEGNQLHFLTSQLHPSMGEALYDVFVTRQGEQPISLRFESVGFDDMYERRNALDGQLLLPAVQ